ncbi:MULTISPECIES: ABC transporter permease [Micrococcus]|uniref:Sulfonate transport system permease protein n=1 Tax=Micrococcus yunnanensis TaxID=566027 RepID=A0ABR6D009_9MICC|nr:MULTISPECIES: ABC transporter permease [Micrococcus]TFI18873.1 ABC transporter permease [Thiopseudomonas sp. 4R-3cl]CVM99240.1 sulfonate/nitrate/taurine transport system permease [Streptococcus pneumoniae]EZP51601.1 ABC transporter, permease protein [Micrococcus luteus]MBA9059449.1 sulfonate transport system permease protein [Micrococcus yunnanensis]MBF0744897.1 ABC transporter permease [Micrococcus yunnanensis]
MSTAPTTPAATTDPEARERSGHDDGDTGARRRHRSRLLERPGARAVVGLAVPAVLLVLWWAVTAAGLLSAVQLPSPGAVLSAGVNLLERGDLWLHVGISTQRVLLGFLLGAALGLAVGSALGLSRWADALFAPLIGALRAVPSLAWVPLLILWMQIGEESKVTLIAIGAFFPVFTTVYAALRHVDPHLVEAGRAFGYHGLSLLRTVQLPAVVPAVFSGLRLALAQAWLFLVAAELIASSMGLGFLLTDSQNNGRTDRLILAIILLAVLGKLTDWLLGLLERRALRRWA